MTDPIEPAATAASVAEETPQYLIGVRLREPLLAEDHLTTDTDLHVGDLVVVDMGGGSAVGEVRGVETCQRMARGRALAMKIVDVEIEASRRRVTVFFNSEERVDFRDLVRDLAREFHARIEMRQIGARDTTKLLDGIGPCGRQLCCSSHLRKFDPISVKMAKAQDMPLTDSRLLGNCGRLKCCLLYEFSTYEELRSRLPRVNTACSADCGGGGCMTGKVRSLRVLKQSVVVGFPDGTEAEVPLDQLTWEGRDHIKPA